jgi:phospholipid/cholesterol/gamma-HCH transport system substrate-binding protein
MKNRNLIVGIFVLAGLTLFTVGLFMIGNRHEAFSRHIEYYAEFADLSGVTKGSKVQVAGMDAGQVVDIAIPSTPSSKFRVHIRINDTLHGLVRADSVVTIGTEGVVGNTFLLIHPGSSQAAAASSGATLASKEPTELADLLDQGKGLITDVDVTVKNANGLLTSVGGNLNTTLTGVRSTVSNVNDVVVGLKEGRGPAGMLLRDKELSAQIKHAVSNTEQATANLNHASGQADALISNIQSRQLPQKVDDTLGSVKSAASNLDATSLQVRQTIAEATEPDVQGVTAGANIRESLSNVNTATGNMADESEALKHNFLLRGFFLHRGYYNLAHLSPDKYRNDRLFANSANPRQWLAADQLFVADTNGKESLTTQGKKALDNVAIQFGDTILSTPLVIEGYSGSGDSAEQLARSESRALIVRAYLESRFHLNAGNLGTVPLRNTPPPNLDRTQWDGICIVALKPVHK